MLLIPAIDLKDGKCVRLRQGNMDESTVYGEDPVAMAKHWADLGAKRIHIVDLDGAIQGKPVHAPVIEQICRTLGDDVQVQIGGGIRSEESAEQYILSGASYIIIGTKAVSEPHFIGDLCIEHPGHIIVGLDCKDGKIAIDGWSKLAQQTPLELAQRFVHDGVEAIVYTDISRDGMLSGANLKDTAELAANISIPVIVSGGLATMDGIKELTKYVDSGILGAITGRAIYEGTIDFAEGAKLLAANPSPYLEY